MNTNIRLKRTVARLLGSLVIGLFWLPTTHAIIIGGDVTGGQALAQGGQFIELSLPFNPPNGAPNAVGNNTFQNPNLYGFNEGQNLSSATPLNVNILASTGSSGQIAANTTIASHYVFFDPDNSTTQLGYVDFDADILAIITSTNRLSQSDPLLINNNVNYLNPSARGLENGDSVWIDTNNAARLQVDWRASTPGDFVRVLTAFSTGGTDPCATNPPGVGGCPPVASVPEPSTMGIFMLGGVGLCFLRRTRRQPQASS